MPHTAAQIQEAHAKFTELAHAHGYPRAVSVMADDPETRDIFRELSTSRKAAPPRGPNRKDDEAREAFRQSVQKFKGLFERTRTK